jgi:hypothetical protein
MRHKLTYTELQNKRSVAALEVPALVKKLGELLSSLEAEQNFVKGQVKLQEINATALLLSALDKNWIKFSNAAFAQVVLASKTIIPTQNLRKLFNERINDHGSANA